jgi:methionyl-tRNA formyltransferase
LLKRNFLSIPRLGVVGFHPAALPHNSGRHPEIWALVLGLTETGSTFFFMDEGADSGDILSQERIIISEDDDAGSLYRKMTHTALEQIDGFLPRLRNGTIDRRPQDLSLANSWRKRQRADGVIDWRMSAQNIHNLVRGLTKPCVGASFIYDGVEFKVWKTVCVIDAPANFEPGRVIQGGACLVVKCGEGAVGLILTEPAFSCSSGVCL